MKRFILICVAFCTVFGDSTCAQSSQDSEFTMAFTGDAIITRKLSVYKEAEYLEMIEIIRDADAAFTNLEVLFHDYESFPMHQSGGTYMRAAPELAEELVWAGFDMVSTANNHTGDYGDRGMRINLKHTSAAGLVHAGSGENLAEAREARFLETAKARVALISCASTFPDHSRAGKSRDDIPARPGLNPLRYEKRYQLTGEQLSELQAINAALGLSSSGRGSNESFSIFGRQFEVGERSDEVTEPNREDLEEIESVVRNASGLADITIVTIHAHERYKSLEVPAQFLETFARAMIDAGADIVVGHGPHVLRGIEIYRDKPIFYSLGDFIFQNETLQRLPYENYERYGLDENNHVSDFNSTRYKNDSIGFPSSPKVWESVIAVPACKEGELSSITLHPITLGYGELRQVRGRPMLADEELGKKIIDDLIELSKPYDTIISWNGQTGVVKLN